MEHSSVSILGGKFHDTLDDVQDPPAGSLPSVVASEVETRSDQLIVLS